MISFDIDDCSYKCVFLNANVKKRKRKLDSTVCVHIVMEGPPAASTLEIKGVEAWPFTMSRRKFALT